MKKDIRDIKTLFVYQVYREGIDAFYEAYVQRLRDDGFDVEGFCITIDPPNTRMTFSVLDREYKKNNRKLALLYERLVKASLEKDVLLLFNGANIHSDVLPQLRTFNAYMCFDDPESSNDLSKPVASFFDACFVGNIASLTQYYSWGCKNVFYRPLGLFSSMVYSNKLNPSEIESRENSIDVCLFCERISQWRKNRIEYLEKKIPDLYGRGKGWPGGWVSDKEMLDIYCRTKIGLNIHNSTGPINLRTFVLPANGIMQICDNKYFLGQIYELNKEVVGYNFIEEVPELVDFYLRHETARQKIAIAGWKRTMRDYSELSVWKKQMVQIQNLAFS